MKNLPDVWGKGALFAYSALEGENSFYKSMCGQLMAEHVGMSFDGKQVDLYLRLKGIPWIQEISYDIVASDLIEGHFVKGAFKFIAADQKTVAGYAPTEEALPVFNADLLTPVPFEGGVAYQCEDRWYAFVKREEGDVTRFAVARDDSFESVAATTLSGLDFDVDGEAEKRKRYFEAVPVLKNATASEQKTLAKCFSVMKSQFLTPDGLFTDLWTTPDRLPHRRWWLWDSVFHSIGNVYLDPNLAFLTIRSILDMQREGGFIPHMCEPDRYIAEHTQPPLVAWGVWKLYERTGKKEWVEAMYDANCRFLDWINDNRDANKNHLYEWYVSPYSPDCRCGESGMDNTPRFDVVQLMDAIDFSCYMANEMRYMVKIAKLLGKDEDAARFETEFNLIKEQINALLYDSEDGRYYDRELESGELRKVATVAGFLPLFSGVCSEEEAAVLAADLANPETFMGTMPVPTVAFNDKHHSIDYWRGTTWICYNYMIQEGLRNYGYNELADEIVDKTIKCMAEWYEREGCIFEVYDPRNHLCPTELERKGPTMKPVEPYARIMTVRDFGWSSTLYTAMIMAREEKIKTP